MKPLRLIDGGSSFKYKHAQEAHGYWMLAVLLLVVLPVLEGLINFIDGILKAGVPGHLMIGINCVLPAWANQVEESVRPLFILRQTEYY